MKHIINTLIIAIGLILPYAIYAQDNTFEGSTDTDWDVATNWSTGSVPTTPITTGVVIRISADCTISNTNTVNYDFQSGSFLQINTGINFTNEGTGTWIMNGTVLNYGTYTQSTMNNGGAHAGTGSFIGSIILTGDVKPGYIPSPFSSCGDELYYDGQSYTTVEIGTQCWMAENLNIGTEINEVNNQTDNGTIEKYCYDCATYGGLYQWNEMMQYVTAGSTQGICPDGWHLPSDGELTTLTSFLGGISIAGGKMKETGVIHWESPNTGATNSSGFTALPGGVRNRSTLMFAHQEIRAYIWSRSGSGVNAYSRYLYYNAENTARYLNAKEHGFSVRCIED